MLYQGINLRHTPLDKLSRLLKDGIILIDKLAFKELQDIIEYSMTKPSFKDALSSLFLLFLSGNDEYIAKIKSSGVLRYSRYINRKCIIAPVLSELLNYEKAHSYLRNEDKEYLTSLLLLSGASISLNKAYITIRDFTYKNLRKYGYIEISKIVLAYVDYIFMSTDYNQVLNPTDLTKEEIAEAASYILYYISSNRDICPTKNLRVIYNYEEFIIQNDIEHIIDCAWAMLQIKEWEILTECFGYQFKEEHDGLLIEPPHIMLDKSIRLGYIRTELQYESCLYRAYSGIGSSAISIIDYATKVQETLGNRFTFEYKEEFGFGRYVMKFPDYVIDVFKKMIIDSDKCFKEDVMYLSLLGREQLITYSDLEDISIQGLSLKEFLKIKNIFIIIGQWLNDNLKKNANNNLNLAYRSLIPILSKEAIKELLLQLTTEEKAQSFLDIISWSPQSERILDIQYNPFINLGDFYAMPLNILANSNSIRNLYALMHKSNELLSNGQDDPLIQIIKDAFNYSNKPCITNIKYSKGDIDIIAKIDNTLLILECKNTLHPTSAHDMRTTWNHITKGQKQLRKIQTAIENKELDNLLENVFGTKSKDFESIYYAVIVSNRLFVGNFLSYPVRSSNDFVNLLHDGMIVTSAGEYCQWVGDSLSARDIYNYFHNNLELKILEQSMIPVRFEYDFIQPTVFRDWYCLDKEQLITRIDDLYNSTHHTTK